jgi:amphi-Trp domain-containing protein
LSESKHENSERLSRQQAAERLTDVAYALMMGDPLELGPDRTATAPIADEVVLRRESRSKGDRVELELELSWSATKAHDH